MDLDDLIDFAQRLSELHPVERIDPKMVDSALDLVNVINRKRQPVLLYSAGGKGAAQPSLFMAKKASLEGVEGFNGSICIVILSSGPVYELVPPLWDWNGKAGWSSLVLDHPNYHWGRNFYPEDGKIAIGRGNVVAALWEHYFYDKPLPKL